MRKVLKTICIIVIALATALALAILVLVKLIDPNDFKDEIGKKVLQSTGRSFEIDGEIAWDLFPRFGVRAQHIRLGNPAGFQSPDFARMDHMNFRLSLSSLIFGRIAVDAITLDGLEVFLERTESNLENWTDFQPLQVSHQQKRKPNIIFVSANRSSHISSPVDISISILDIQNANIYFNDQVTESKWHLEGFQGRGHSLQMGEAFPIRGSFILHHDLAEGPIRFSGDVVVDPNKGRFGIEDLNIQAQLEQLLDIKKPPLTTLNISAIYDDELDTLQLTKCQGALLGAPMTAQLSLSRVTDMPEGYGSFSLNDVYLEPYHFESVTVNMRAQDGLLKFDPIRASAYEGNFDGEGQLALYNLNPGAWSLKGELDHLSLGALLKDVTQVAWADGQTKVSIELSGQNIQPTPWYKGVRGAIQFGVTHGWLAGFDIDYLFSKTEGKAKSKADAPENQGKTVFETLTATLVLSDGIVKNEDLLLTGQHYSATGRGQCTLREPFMSSKLNYQFESSLTRKEKQYPLLIRVDGRLEHLEITPDLEGYLKHFLEKQMKNKLLDGFGLGATMPAVINKSEAEDGSSDPAENQNGKQTSGTNEEIPAPFREIEKIFRGSIFQ